MIYCCYLIIIIIIKIIITIIIIIIIIITTTTITMKDFYSAIPRDFGQAAFSSRCPHF